MKKRLFTLILAFSMLTTALPSPAYAADIRGLLNSAALQPTANDLYAERVNEILAECGYGTADTYTVFKNCYTWLVENVRYRTDEDPYEFMSFSFSPQMDQTFINAKAFAPLYQGVGVCTEYAAALYVMAQAIGLKPYLCSGETRKSGGGYTGHAWMGVELNGQIYMFDPQVEDNVAKGGTIHYYYFGKTLEELGGSHILDEDAFRLFKIANGYALDDTIRVQINGRTLRLDQDPVVLNGRTLVPLRNIFEAMGAEVTWDGNTKQITAVRDDITIYLQIDGANMYKNGAAIPLDVPAKIINGRTLVPTRAIAEAFGCAVNWNSKGRIVEIERSDADIPEEFFQPEEEEEMGYYFVMDGEEMSDGETYYYVLF